MVSPDDPIHEPSPTEPRGNPLLRMIVMHWALGGALGLACAGALLALNPLGFRTLLLHSDAMIPGLVMLFVGFGTTFGGVVAATAVMFHRKDDEEDDDESPHGGLREFVAELAPAPVRAPRPSARLAGFRRYPD